jgi:hypothetical protein
MKPVSRFALVLVVLALAACSHEPADQYAIETPGYPTAPPRDAPADVIASPGVPLGSPRAPQVAPLPPPEGLPTMPPPDSKPEIQPRAIAPDDGPGLGPVEVAARSARGDRKYLPGD